MFDFDELEEALADQDGGGDDGADDAASTTSSRAPSSVAVDEPSATDRQPGAQGLGGDQSIGGYDDGYSKVRALLGQQGRQSADDEAADRERSVVSVLAAQASGDPYAVLGIDYGATSSEVRRAYHRLALLHHPDKAGHTQAFRAVAEAYKSLTAARDEQGGWRDIEGAAIGPWQAHSEQVNAVLFDAFGAPPWEGRRLYTGSFSDGAVRCWELSTGEPGKTPAPPRLVGEIKVGGFFNDIAALSPTGLLTAQSAGMRPQPGESLRAWDLARTPFKPVSRKKGPAAISDKRAGHAASATAALARSTEDKQGTAEGEVAPPKADEAYLTDSQMVFLHYRGVRVISPWPRMDSSTPTPHHVATVSRDWLALSKIGADGCSIEQPAVWKVNYPHTNENDVNALRHESISRLWTGANDGLLKCWDVNSTASSASKGAGNVAEIRLKSKTWVTGLEMWPSAGVIVAAHTSGIAYGDMRTGSIIREQYTNNPVSRVCCPDLGHHMLFAGIGKDLMQYDTRCFHDGVNAKPAVLGSWTLRAKVTSIGCATTSRGNIIVAVGCEDGKVAALDTT